jgi:endonuclease V-like protein UPF0215 family
MQTIKITITSPAQTNIVLKECNHEGNDVTDKIAKLLKVKKKGE